MRFRSLLVAFAAVLASPSLAEDTIVDSEPVEVMVLGMYHFANPGLDEVNIEVDDVLAPTRQREIEVLVDALAEWQPSRIAVENLAEPPSLEMSDYHQTEELLRTSRNESVQVGYRLARQLGHEAVYGYDEQPAEGEPNYFPMDKVQKFAKEKGGMDLIRSLFTEVQAMANEEQEALLNQTIAESLINHNDEEQVGKMHDKLYYSLLKIGDGEAQPGAELNAYWYMRNAKMFAKIDMIAAPGDRVLVLAGSGHATWLKHFVRRMPGYRLVEALPVIERAAEVSQMRE